MKRASPSIERSIEWMKEKFSSETLWVLRKISGKDNSSLPPDYWVIGFGQEPAVGERICMVRLANKEFPEGRHGWFESTPIKSVARNDGWDFWVIQTENSIYELTRLGPRSVFDGFMEECKKTGFDPYQDSE